MKNRFSTYDIMCMVTELQRLIGMRVNQVYDIDSRTYVIRLQQSEEKAILLLESGNRFHTTQFEWPKNVAPSGFTMKLRKHLKNKRLEKLSQIGIDRVIDLQFGSGEAAYHIILELYDRGNIMLTDCDWTILNVLRPHVEGDKVRFAVKEKYPLDRAKTSYEAPTEGALREILANSKPGDNLKKILNPNLEYGSSIIDHVLQENGLAGNLKLSKEAGKGFYIEQDLERLMTALKQAEKLLDDAKTQVAKGYILQKREERPNPSGEAPTFLLSNVEFHPMWYRQLQGQPVLEYETFDRAVDEFFSQAEGQKIDLKTVQIEREAMKKLQNVRKDHEKRVHSLKEVQVKDRRAAELIARNEPLVEQCRMAVQAAIANQILTTLNFLATGSYQKPVGQDWLAPLSQPSVSRCIEDVVNALNDVLPTYVKFPTTEQERNIIKQGFYEKFGMPGVIGCIDGTLIAIVAPRNHPSEAAFFCRKGYHAINAAITWRDMRNNVKKKASHNANEHRGYGPNSTGHGPSTLNEFSQVDEQVLSVMGPVAVYGLEDVACTEMSWDDIKLLVKTAQENNDPIASCIKHLKLTTNHITLHLTDPYDPDDDDDDGDERLEPMLVDIDLSLTAFANARRYYDQKRGAAKKQQKTLESADKALKSAERKTKQTLKEANTVSNIIKARRTYWFEKFYWFISSDNYLVIAGRDQQQNELLVKRYMRATDIYVHAEVTGASSVVVKNPGGGPIPPKTLNEAGQAAVAYSVAWEAKVVTRAWWVNASQVSKSAPSGEYLGTGSFMIRGKKNYLLTDQLSFGFSFMFRLEDSCIERHRDERKPALIDDGASDVTSGVELDQDQEIPVSDGDDDSEADEPSTPKLETISEESPSHKNKQKETTKETKHNKTEESRQQKDTSIEVEIKENIEQKESQIDTNRDQETDSETETQDTQLEGGKESDSSDGDFTDTHIKVDHGTGEVILKSKARTISEASDRSDDKSLSFPSLPKKGGKRPQKKPEPKQEKKEASKRGQKGKMKKIKDKYKDQDEDDRLFAMELLQSAKEKKEEKKVLSKSKSKQKSGPKIPAPAPLILEADSEPHEEEHPENAEVEQAGPDADAELLSQLTGAPLTEDELLFAVPVVAPYAALHSYKYKVKLTPGTSKRGKAAKTAVQVFLRDKTATNREKDLLKAVKEENVARNFPGKVKLSAPQLHKHKK